MLPAGQLNRRVQLQRRKAGGSLGHPSTDWEDMGKPAWARIRAGAGAGNEAIIAGQVASRVGVTIRLRFRQDVTASMRVLHKGAVYDIEAVQPDWTGREYVDLVCVEFNHGAR